MGFLLKPSTLNPKPQNSKPSIQTPDPSPQPSNPCGFQDEELVDKTGQIVCWDYKKRWPAHQLHFRSHQNLLCILSLPTLDTTVDMVSQACWPGRRETERKGGGGGERTMHMMSLSVASRRPMSRMICASNVNLHAWYSSTTSIYARGTNQQRPSMFVVLTKTAQYRVILLTDISKKMLVEIEIRFQLVGGQPPPDVPARATFNGLFMFVVLINNVHSCSWYQLQTSIYVRGNN